MKTNKFGIVSAAISALALICTFVLDFLKVTPVSHPLLGKMGANVTAWQTFTGGDEVVAKGIQDNSSAGTFVIIAVVLLVANIVIQLFKSGKIAALVNTVVSIATAAIFFIVGRELVGSDKLEIFKPEMAFGAYFIIALCLAMLFVPKMVSKK